MKRVADNLTAASLSPDGHRLAVTARGEVFDVPAEKGVTRDITRTPGANEREGEWSPNGKQIAYISDRTGETEIWLQSIEGGDPIQLTQTMILISANWCGARTARKYFIPTVKTVS